jgi:hypothetical protein
MSRTWGNDLAMDMIPQGLPAVEAWWAVFMMSVIEGATDGEAAAVEDVGIDHRCSDVFVTEEFLHEADVVAAFEQVDGKGVAQGLWCDTLGDPRRASGLSDRLA